MEIAETYWIPTKADQPDPAVVKRHMVDVPQYQGGKAGELWVLRRSGGGITVVSSDFQPDHLSWPGSVKGWPVPGVEYQRTLQDRAIAESQSAIDLYVQSLEELKNEPGRHALEE